jgi:hypothetical protein
MLYGRSAQCDVLERLLADARRSRSGALVVRGEAGAGKTALLEHAAGSAHGMLVLRANGVESEAELPFAALHQLLRPVLGLAGRLPEPQANALGGALGLKAAKGNDRFLVSVAVLSLLAEAAEDRAVLCLVDEAQWLDRSSAEALAFAARRLEAEGVVLVFAARDGDLRDFPADGLPELRLEGLEVEDAAALLAGAGAELPAEVVCRLVERTGGNPLALLELPASLAPEQLAGRAPLDDVLPLGTRLERTFGDRVRRLPGPARTLMLVAAAETTGDAAVVLRAGDRLGAGAEALEAAEAAALVRTTGGRVAFRHPLVRSAAYLTGSLAARQAAHRALADVLTGEDAADQRAWHRAAASVGPDETRPRPWSARPTGPAAGAATPRPRRRWSGRRRSPATTGSGDGGWPRPPPPPGWPARPTGRGPCWTGPSRWPPTRPPRSPWPTCAARSRPAAASPWTRWPCSPPPPSWPRPSPPARLCTCWSRRARSPATPGT